VAKKVLVVDDERDIVDLLEYNLTREGFEVISAHDGTEALVRAQEHPDLIILDLMMPGLDGFETCKRLKADPRTSATPVMFLTARDTEVDEIVGLELGADDYIRKPISPRKLVARVRALFRRAEAGGEQPEPIIEVGRLKINRANYTVRLGGTEMFFPRKEFEVLAFLAAHRGKVFSREMLLNQVWGTDVVVTDRTVDVHIRKIREKLGEDALLIETIKGVGYRFKE
jgi:two-component system, OmpR family, alkaline phosphatase synthesis response regulator PhoP